jgi:Tol biopolymer transport system component
MKRPLLSFVAMVVLAGWQLTAAPQQSAAGDRRLAAAKHKATVDGDLKSAIELYRQVVDDAGANRALAAQALVEMAECHSKLGNAEAQKIYRDIVSRYADQTAQADVARERLGRATTAAAPVRGDRAVWTGGDVDLFGTISPDGRYLTYVDWELGNIMLRDLVAGTSRSLTNNGKGGYEHGDPHFSAISSDGKHVAYGWSQSGGAAAARAELRIAPLDEPTIARTRTLWSANATAIRPFQWSHDNTKIAVLVEHADATSQLGVLSKDGSLKTLTSLGWRGTERAVFSPDSRYLAYDAAASGSMRHDQIHIIAADASTKKIVFEDASANTVMGWSLDGRHLLFASDRSGALALWALPVRDGRADGSAFVVRTDLASTWSLGMTSSGAMYLWKRSGASYVSAAALDLETGRLETKPAFNRFVESRGRPSWSDDGKALLYVSCGPSGGGPCGMFVWSSETGSVAEVPHSLNYVVIPRLSPDRRTILTNGTDRNGRRSLHLIDTASGESRLSLPGAGQAIDFSVDGGAFYYVADRSGRRSIVERQIQSGLEREVIAVPAGCNRVRLSPNRTLAGCTGRVGANQTGTFLVAPMDGGSSQAVFRVGDGEALSNFWSWLPDNRGALLVRTDIHKKDSLWYVPLDGTPRRLDVDISKWTHDGHFHVQPSGKHLAFLANAGEPGSEIWALENVLPRPVK